MDSTAPAHRVVLIPDRTARAAHPHLRRFRLVRLPLDRPPSRADRFGHLKRTYD